MEEPKVFFTHRNGILGVKDRIKYLEHEIERERGKYLELKQQIDNISNLSINDSRDKLESVINGALNFKSPELVGVGDIKLSVFIARKLHELAGEQARKNRARNNRGRGDDEISKEQYLAERFRDLKEKDQAVKPYVKFFKGLDVDGINRYNASIVEVLDNKINDLDSGGVGCMMVEKVKLEYELVEYKKQKQKQQDDIKDIKAKEMKERLKTEMLNKIAELGNTEEEQRIRENLEKVIEGADEETKKEIREEGKTINTKTTIISKTLTDKDIIKMREEAFNNYIGRPKNKGFNNIWFVDGVIVFDSGKTEKILSQQIVKEVDSILRLKLEELKERERIMPSGRTRILRYLPSERATDYLNFIKECENKMIDENEVAKKKGAHERALSIN
ncbi:MAG: hypothetical protein LBC92_01690 [Rickettsiales bacterium]|jgi:hypothetical protein|nr:hypothetical protein [Rickettsiales bacterium]